MARTSTAFAAAGALAMIALLAVVLVTSASNPSLTRKPGPQRIPSGNGGAQAKKAAPRPKPKQVAKRPAKLRSDPNKPVTRKSATIFVKFSEWLSKVNPVNAVEDEVEEIFDFFRDNAVRIFQLNKRLAVRPGPKLRLSTTGPHVGMSRTQFLEKRLGYRQSPSAGKRSIEDTEDAEQRIISRTCYRIHMQPDPRTGAMAEFREQIPCEDTNDGWGPQPPRPQPRPSNDPWAPRPVAPQPWGPQPRPVAPQPWGPPQPRPVAPQPWNPQPRPPQPWGPVSPPQPQPRPPSPRPNGPVSPFGPVSPRPSGPRSPDRPLAPLAAGSVDLRSTLPGVVDQGQCGSCWAFAAAAAIEGSVAVATGSSPVKLSEQALMDCSRAPPNNGCGGGNPITTFDYVRSAGIPTGASYPYRQSQGQCRSFNAATKVSGYRRLRGEQEVIEWLNTKGPVSTVVFAGAEAWEYYREGVIRASDCGSSRPDHALNIVGYSEIDGTPVWIVRNSWGSRWGMSGYAFVQRGVNACGIESGNVGVLV